MSQNTLQQQSASSSPIPASASSIERTRNRRVFIPATDIYETPDTIVLWANMPGVTQDKVHITLRQDVLTIEGLAADTPKQDPYNLIYSEYEPGDYHRVFTLTTDVDDQNISATMKDGVLTLVIKKTEPAKARKIDVRSA